MVTLLRLSRITFSQCCGIGGKTWRDNLHTHLTYLDRSQVGQLENNAVGNPGTLLEGRHPGCRWVSRITPMTGVEGHPHPHWSGEWRAEGGGWRVESGGRRAEGGGRRAESGERRAESGERRAESGERRAESGESSPLMTDYVITTYAPTITLNAKWVLNILH